MTTVSHLSKKGSVCICCGRERCNPEGESKFGPYETLKNDKIVLSCEVDDVPQQKFSRTLSFREPASVTQKPEPLWSVDGLA